jgi:hypothetical protein
MGAASVYPEEQVWKATFLRQWGLVGTSRLGEDCLKGWGLLRESGVVHREEEQCRYRVRAGHTRHACHPVTGK